MITPQIYLYAAPIMNDWMIYVWISISACLWVQDDPIYPTPPLEQDMTQGQFFKRSLAGLNSEFSFS